MTTPNTCIELGVYWWPEGAYQRREVRYNVGLDRIEARPVEKEWYEAATDGWQLKPMCRFVPRGEFKPAANDKLLEKARTEAACLREQIARGN